MKKILKEKFEAKSLLGIRTVYQEWDEVIIGFIKSLDEKTFVVHEVDEYGESLGETTIEFSEIISIEFDDNYQKKLKLIVDSSLFFKSDKQVTIWRKSIDLRTVILELIKEGIITTLFFDEDFFVTGKINKLDNEFVTINNISVGGEDDGFSMHSIDKLIGVRFNGREELKIKFLFENN